MHTSVTSVLGLLAGIVSALQKSGAMAGYGLQDIAWKVQAFPTGPELLFNGTVQEVHRQLRKINPNFDTDFSIRLAQAQQEQQQQRQHSRYYHQYRNTTHQVAAVPHPRRLFLDKRYDLLNYSCFGTWSSASETNIWEGQEYLRGIPGKPGAAPGPANCGRVSCSYHSAIYWCNDSPDPKQLDSFSNIADGALFIIDHCRDSGGKNTAGQIYYRDSWNVVVRGDTC